MTHTSEAGQDTSGMVVPQLLKLRAEQHPDRVVVNIDGGDTLTYAEWYQRATAVAHGLIDRGVGRGDRIGLMFGGLDWINYVIGYLGVVTSGATAVHIHDGIDEAELGRRITECSIGGMIHGMDVAVPELFHGWTSTVAELDTGDTSPVDADLRPDDLADILYTSGTTGPAKAISTPHGNLSFGRGPEGFRQLGEPKPVLAPFPLGTTSSATTTSVPLTMAATLIVTRPDDVEQMAALIEKYAMKSVMVTPWIATQMVAARVHERHDLSAVQTVATASAPLPSGIAKSLLHMMPNAQITSVYAAREAVPAVVVTTYDPQRPRAVGRPAPGTELRVVDETGTPVPDGEIGEIWLRSAAPKRLFLDGAEESGPAEAGDNWTRTRDLGYIGADGDLYLFDRDSDAIQTPSGLVSSTEVEAALYEQPAVQQAAVVGVPGKGGAGSKAIVAFVVLADPDSLTGVRSAVEELLQPHQRPVRYQLVDSLPRGIMGKVLKHELRRRAAAG